MAIQSYVQILGNHPTTIPTQLLIAHYTQRILVNTGENTQRFCLEHKVKLSRISDILLTHISPSTVSGLPGLLLTLETGDCSFPVNSSTDRTLPSLKRQWSEFKGGLGNSWCRSFHRHLLGQQTGPCNEELRKVRLWGPPPLYQFFSRAVEEFAPLRHLDVEINELVPNKEIPPFITLSCPDANIKDQFGVLSLRLWCPDYGRDDCVAPTSKKRRICITAGNETNSREWDDVVDEDPNECNDNLEKRCAEMRTMLVIVQFPKQPGRMDPKKLEELQIPRGPWLSKLKSGESVTLKDGREIHPLQVCNEAKEGEQFAIFGFQREQLIPENMFDLTGNNWSVIFDLSSPNVIKSSHYLNWICSIEASQIPIISCFSTRPEFSPQPFVSSACLQNVLRSFAPSCFPLGILDSLISDTIVDFPESNALNITQGHLLDKWLFSPISEKRGIDRTCRLTKRSPTYAEDRINRLSTINPQVEECRKLFAELIENKNDGEESNKESNNVLLTFLGTGSAMPSKYRNVSGILLKIMKRCLSIDSSFLFDCGEGSISQIFRFSSSIQEFHSTLRSLQMVFISHRHADHHLGLPFLLNERHRLFPQLNPPTVIAPTVLESWLQFWDDFVTPCPHQFINCKDGLCIHLRKSFSPDDLPAIELKLAAVDHIQNASLKPIGCYGIRMNILKQSDKDENEINVMSRNVTDKDENCEERNVWNIVVKNAEKRNPLTCDNNPIVRDSQELYWSISYSGDTRPCDNFIQLARNCHVLIHEGTFEDECENEAQCKRHSTLGQALDVATKSNSDYLLVTHFSQRYPTIPMFTSTNSIVENSIIVFDGFSVSINSLFRVIGQNKTLGKLLSQGIRQLKPILTVLRDE